jgi:hypothetical protein
MHTPQLQRDERVRSQGRPVEHHQERDEGLSFPNGRDLSDIVRDVLNVRVDGCPAQQGSTTSLRSTSRSSARHRGR